MLFAVRKTVVWTHARYLSIPDSIILKMVLKRLYMRVLVILII